MAEQSNTTDPGPQDQGKDSVKATRASEPWWMDHVRQIVVGSPASQTPAPPGPPTWALSNQPSPQPSPQQPSPQQPWPQPATATPAAQEHPAPEPAAPEQPPQAPAASEQPEPQPIQPEPELRGNTSKLPIASILGFLSMNRQSGTLHLTNVRETFTLEILEGDVVHASSNLSTDEQLLGSILVARDKIGTEQLEDFYKRFTPDAEAIDSGDQEDLVSREDLKLALEAQVQELFNRLYAANDCTFCFYEGETSGVEQRIRMNVTRLLLESARNLDELERPDPVDPAEAVDEETVEAANTENMDNPDQTDTTEDTVDPDSLDSAVEPCQSDGAVEPYHSDGGLGVLDQIDAEPIVPDSDVEATGAIDEDNAEPISEAAPLSEAEPFSEAAPFSEAESFDETSEFDDTVPFDGAVPVGNPELPYDIPPFDDTAPFDDDAPFASNAPSVDTEELGEYDEFVDMADEADLADQRDVAP